MAPKPKLVSKTLKYALGAQRREFLMKRADSDTTATIDGKRVRAPFELWERVNGALYFAGHFTTMRRAEDQAARSVLHSWQGHPGP